MHSIALLDFSNKVVTGALLKSVEMIYKTLAPCYFFALPMVSLYLKLICKFRQLMASSHASEAV